MDGRSGFPQFVEIGQVPHLPLGRSEGSERSNGSSPLGRVSSGKAANADVRAPPLSRFGWVTERRNDDESSAHHEEDEDARDALDESNRSNLFSCFAAASLSLLPGPPFAALADEDTTVYSHSSAGSVYGDEDGDKDKLAEIAALEKRLRQLKAEAATERANNHPAKEEREEAVEVGWEEREDSHHFFFDDGKPPLIASIPKPRQFNEQPEIDNCSVVSGAISLPELERNVTTESTHVECRLANKDVSIAVEANDQDQEPEENAEKNAEEDCNEEAEGAKEEGSAEEEQAAKDDVAVLSIQGDVPVEAMILDDKTQGGAGSAVQHSAWYEADKGEWSVPPSVSIDPDREGAVESWSTTTLPSINSRTKKMGPAGAVKRLLSAVQRQSPIPEEIAFIEQRGSPSTLQVVAEDEYEEEEGEEMLTLAVWQPRKHCETMHLRRGGGTYDGYSRG